ncbi:MBG domain-containing protein [Secundilactobacillus hailunensis]|uniref:MBG domain-containing protein n=1 Tax=Secundilactobacillus hailunensis TaxID=2559923 RepID=UPI00148524E6|nr:MBG domain-containing protein [Secundilactobacillus hailunensis]
MKKQTMQQKRRRLLEDSSQLKEHFKMYKVGRIWLFAGLLTVSLGAGIALGDQQDVHAATDATPTSQQATVPAAQTSLPATNTANSDVQANDANQAGMKADTNGQPATDTATTDPAADANNANTNVNTDNNVNKDTKTTNNASTKTANVNATPTSTGETPAADNTAAAPKTDATHAAVTNDVQTTDLGNVDNESTIDQAKAAAAKAYQATGKPQAVVATSGTEEPAPVEATHVTVQNTTKTYDGKTDTPANYAVELSDNLTAPQGWYVTDTINQYLVDPTDLNLSQVGQNVGSYDITLSATGLQKLNAVAANQQKNLTVSAADVTAGKLTITKAPVPTGTVAILAAAKPYDNDATTDPTSYNVQLDAGIVAPNDWTKNTDGTYKVNVASGDLDTAITSQTAGDYQVTLSNAGLQKLNALNANYDITADKVTSGGFQIQDNTKLNIGVAGIAPNAVLPTTLTVGVSRTETVPTDWTVNYNNIAQDSEVYNVPISYFDISAVDNTKIGTYTVNLTTAALNNLNAANPDKQLAVTNIQAGKVFVTNDTSLPVRDLSNFGGGLASLNEIVNKEGDNKANPVFSNGAGFDMSLSFFGTTSEKQNNFTNIVIVPAGLTIATATSNSVDGKTTTVYTKADDPATAIANQVQPQL